MCYREEVEDAIDEGDLELFCSLFNKKDLACNEYDGSLLHYVAENGTTEFARFLVENGAEIDRPGGTFNAPPITYAAAENLEMVRYLIEEAGAKVDVSRILCNPLMQAISEGKVEIVEYLLSAGIDPHLTYRHPMDGTLKNAYMAAQGRDEIVKLLEKHGCRNPVEGENKPVWEPSQERLLNHTFAVREETPENQRYRDIIQYMEERFGPADTDGMQEFRQVVDGMSLAINLIQPNEEHPFWVLFTNGMSDLAMKVPSGQEAWQYAELVMHLPEDWIHPREAGADLQWLWPAKWLRILACEPHLEESWLGPPATIASTAEPPEPLGLGAEQSCFLMLPDLSNLNPPLQTDDRQVHFFTVVPLYTEERDFEVEHGMDKFFDKFLEHEVPLTVDLRRPNFATT